ncbi:MAG: hypothetical protein ACOCPW_04360, partial [Marinilabiliaceae bacterium]
MLNFLPELFHPFAKTVSRGTILVLFFAYFMSNAHGQEGHFSKKGKEGYFEEIEETFKSSPERKKAKDDLDQLETFWYNENTPERVKEVIIELSDFLYEKRASAYPNYHLMLTTFEAFVENDQVNEGFSQWHKGVSNLTGQRGFSLRHLNDLLENTKNILTQQKIFSSRSVDWFSRSPEYQFIFSNDSLKLSIPDTRLVCYVRDDSLTIYDAQGTLNLINGQWQGEKGRITWEQHDLDRNQVYAVFDEHVLDMGQSSFNIEDVTFYNNIYFNEPLKGRLELKIRPVRRAAGSNYPKFESYEQIFSIQNIHPGMHYEGGFSQHGAKFRGSGTNEDPASITVERNDSVFITAESLIFALREDEIVSRNTHVTMHLDTGKIQHPGLEFKYKAPSKELFLMRSGKGISRSPFFDSYHNINIDSEIISWSMNDPYMELRRLPGAARNYSFFESLSYFRESFYRELQGMDAIHPLSGLKKCYNSHDKKPFTAKDYARFIKKPESQVKQQILKLSFHGFLEYNTNTDTIKIRERLTDYLKFRTETKDYDVIKFKSETPGKEPNAIFDLRNYDLAMNGVENISISDHQNVAFRPENEEVTMKYNRNFNFNGHILAGMIGLYGEGFFFTYDDFLIDMQNIDSMQMRVLTNKKDEYGRRLGQDIDNTIAKLSGHLKIDSANNKSGREDHPEFPVLVSDESSYVYYERDDIQEGAYKKDDFYFELEPFSIDSINELTRQNILFEGKLVSNIFPELKEKLTVQNDYSLGFVKNSPPEGYPIYNEKARFTNKIDLSNDGLKGEGNLEYLTSRAESESFTFLPEETRGTAFNFEVDPQATEPQYPDVQGREIDINFLPEEDRLIAENMDEEFDIFEKETSFNGRIVLTPSGAKAGGRLSMPHSSLEAKNMMLSHHALTTDSANFNLLEGEDMEGVSFKTNNVEAEIDFEERQGRFHARDRGNMVEFSDNLYIAYISEFSWNMDQNDIYMGARGSEGNRFVSTHRGQDSLDFKAPLATYDIESKTIQASEVNHLTVADSRILLNDGEITIHEEAEMAPLDSTTIEVNEGLHTFENASVEVSGKYDYTATGEYIFTNGEQNDYTIHFDEIATDDEQQTYAEGDIGDEDLFTFNKYFAFNGDIELSAKDTLLTFDGGTQLLHPCSEKGPQGFIRFNAPIDPNNVVIPLEDRTYTHGNEEREELVRGFFLQMDSTHAYSAFLEKSRRANNNPIITADGQLRYNEDKNCFEIASEEKMAHPDSTGSILRYHTETCQVSGEGELNPGLEFEQVKTHFSGTIKHLREENEIKINSLFGVDFMLDENSINTIVNTITASEVPDAIHDEANIKRQLREWLPDKEATNIVDVLEPTTDMTEILPDNIKHTLFFTDIEFTWDTPSRSYKAEGKADLGWMKDNAISREIDVKALLSRSRGGNSLEIHIQTDQDTWFFFSYHNETMQVLSSLDEFNQDLRALKTEERKMDTGLGKDSYVFRLGSESRLRKFMENFEDPEEANENDEEGSNQEENNS